MPCLPRLTCALRWAAIAVGASLLPAHAASPARSYGAPPPGLQASLERLVRAYPDWIARVDGENLILKDGRKFPISDHRTDKSFSELLERPDIDDMFFAPYPAGAAPHKPGPNEDPGRVRYEPLFVAMYGDCYRQRLHENFRAISWLPRHHGGSVLVTKINGVDKALAAVSRELDALPDSLIRYLKPTSGTFKCRRVAGSTVRSMHAYGAAIDINTRYADYWRHVTGNRDALAWRNRIPAEIVRIFERHGFIWGGTWYHYDTMHFEYRPELLPETPR